MPFKLSRPTVKQHLANGLTFFTDRENGETGNVAFAELVGRLFYGVGNFYKILGNGAQVFST